MRRVLERPSLEVILRFCDEDPVERVFLEDIARRGLGQFYAVEEKGRITALCHTGANLVPSGRGVSALARIASRLEPRMIVGEERAVGELWRSIARRFPVPLDDRPGQPVFVIDRAPSRAGTGLRPAALDDLERLVPACAAAYLEEVGVDAYARDPDLFTWRTRSQIQNGRSWLWLEDGRIRFKAEASAWTPAAVQLSQVWVDPALRGRGYGKAAFADLCDLLLARVPRVCLFARPDNTPALRLYDSVGMQRTIAYRSLIFG